MTSIRRRLPLLLRRLLGFVIGVVVAVLIIDLVEWIRSILFPFMPDIEVDDAAHLAAAMAAVPLPAKLIVVLGWFLGTATGAAAALRVAQWRPIGWAIAVVIIADGIVNVLAAPPPLWMQAATILAPLAGAWLAERGYHHARRGDPLIGPLIG